MSREQTLSASALQERDWNPCSKQGWFAFADAEARTRPPAHTTEQLAAMPRAARLRHDHARALWHANLGPIRTPAVDAIFEELDEIVGSNRQDGDKVKPAAVLDALPGLGKTTAAMAFGRVFHRDQIDLHGPEGATHDGSWQRIPVIYLGLTSNTTMRSLNAMLCRFFGLPGVDRGSATLLAHRAADCVAHCKTRLIIVDDVHFLDVNRRDGREVANHFKWLANTFPVTFLFVGVGLRARGLLDEGLSGTDAAFSQTARRWNVLSLAPFEISTATGRRTWRQLLLGIERELVLAHTHRGMLANDLSDYLFARSTGHFASLMSLISRGCYRAIKTGTETLTGGLLDAVRIDQAAETARGELHAAIEAGLLSTRPRAGHATPRTQKEGAA
ncbi:ATP-binding protein [Lentzea sp. BCCO 10_0061]|uniref:ATP-binding protein n=1 Tax=Lentzea sokolovensis TaxID=3095429 RepID=A0ABU4UWW7_9PSEU|nr:ATP-binding protein [Lentzea sp. BCCO 10_0061]MDX8143283.1 ATP-binding protein [Lentzea sp. BCCO 10_0061]